MNSPETQPQKTMKEKYKSLPKRVFTSCIALTLLSIIIFLDLKKFEFPWSIAFASAIVSSFIVYEYFQMAIKSGQTPFIKIGIFFTALLFAAIPIHKILSFYQISITPEHLQIWILMFALMACFYQQSQNTVCEKAFEGVASTISGIIYIGLLGSYLLQIAWMHILQPDQKVNGIYLLGFSVLIIKMTDIGAFMIGVAFGKHKWIPRISPGKSIEGLIGGMISATLLGLFLDHFVWNIFDQMWKTIVFGLVIAYTGQLSDLVESIFKRSAGMKDSATYLPGFGGFFDLLDSLIVSAPIAFLLFKFLL
jgi:phosphatidate cytidylyltransferase